MKTSLRLFCAAVVLLFLAGCASGGNAATYRIEDGLDLDLTKLSGTMVYSEVYNMRYDPDEYYGMRIRISGLFSVYRNPETGDYCFNCVIPDATACCAQGLQFFVRDGLVYPDDFPEEGDTVTLQGTFSLDENNIYMCSLTDAVIESWE